ncbi:MAG: hypothetical protein KDJ52_19625 [Anaerolineae bacterium]|nr:hypothetical protein [Anaerolineae bacterium]
MLNTYKAILRGNQLEWSEDVPIELLQNKVIVVHVTILDQPVSPVMVSDQGERMVEALEELAKTNALADINDPVAWERDQRQDRVLPKREQ